MRMWQFLDATLTRLRPWRQTLCMLLDAFVLVLAWQATYLFRLGFERWISARPDYDSTVLLALVLLYLVMLWLFKVPKGMWRFSGFGEISRLLQACLLSGVVGAAVIQMAGLRAVPRAVLALHPLFSVIGLAMMRLGYRMLYEHLRARVNGSAQETKRALVMGAGQAGRLLLAGIQHQGWTVVGWLDDDAAKANTRIAGVPVLGPLDAVKHHAAIHGITHVIVAMPSVRTSARRRALDLAADCGCPVLTVPSSSELRAGSRVEQLRDIEPADLLGRAPVQLDETGILECISGRVVLITGAGGSIGSELCRQVARYHPRQLMLVDVSEASLYLVEQQLGETFPQLSLVRLVADVKDADLMHYLFRKHRPHLVFHAAAYKHVPLMEKDNAWMALFNNTIGTYRVAKAAAQAGVDRFVLISTDKAVNPTNVMGASKRAAELVLSAIAPAYTDTAFIAVRFGNVLGSSGSVIPKFKEQIAKGGPVTVTHPEIIRFFMTISEAARLVIQAGVIGKSSQVILLDMGDPVRIVDLARDLIRLSGHTEREIPIVFSGLRPGEKLYEELLADSDTTLPTSSAYLRLARLASGPSFSDIESWIDELLRASRYDDDFARDHLKRWIPEFLDARAEPVSSPAAK